MGRSDQEDDIETMRIQQLKWLPPVKSPEDLPIEGVAEGVLCFVEGEAEDGEEEVWQHQGGVWHKIDNL